MHQNGNELFRSKFICLQNLINLLDGYAMLVIDVKEKMKCV